MAKERGRENRVLYFGSESTIEETGKKVAEMLLDGWRLAGQKPADGDAVRVYFVRGENDA